MTSEWAKVPLGSLLKIEHGWPFKSEYFSQNDSEPIVLSIGNFDYTGGLRFDRGVVKRYSGEYPESYNLGAGDVVLIMTCQTSGGEILGIPGRVPDDGQRYLHNQRIGKVIVQAPELIDSDFLYHFACTPLFNQQLVATASGSKILHTAPRRIEEAMIDLPPLPEQRAIAEVLGALDEKIAANTALAVVTDALVRARYDALLATAHEELRLGVLATNIRDQIRPGSVASTTRYVGLEHLARRRMWLSESGRATDVTSAKSRFSEGDVLFGKLRPYFHKVVLAPVDGISSTDILVLRARKGSLAGLVLAAAASDETIAHCTASSEGTRMPRASWKDLDALTVPWPGATEAEAFSAVVLDLARMVAAKMTESATLAGTRDVLLPLLMSGKVRVKDAEKVAEETL